MQLHIGYNLQNSLPLEDRTFLSLLQLPVQSEVVLKATPVYRRGPPHKGPGAEHANRKSATYKETRCTESVFSMGEHVNSKQVQCDLR